MDRLSLEYEILMNNLEMEMEQNSLENELKAEIMGGYVGEVSKILNVEQKYKIAFKIAIGAAYR